MDPMGDAFVTCSVNLNVRLKADMRCENISYLHETLRFEGFLAHSLWAPKTKKKQTDGAKAKAKVKVAPKKAVNPDEVETVLKLRDPS